MPASPELRNAAGYIRILKIFFIMEARHQSHADCHIRIGGKIKIFIDGGIRTGIDIVRVLALGADAVLIGRPYAIAAFGGGIE